MVARDGTNISGSMRFLIVRIAALGDVVTSTPLVTRIRAEHPGAHITWLCGAGVRDLVTMLPGVDEVLSVDERRLLAGNIVGKVSAVLATWRQLLGRSFDRVLMLHPDPRYGVLTLPLVFARHIRASHGPGPGTNPMRGRFRGDESARLLDGSESIGPGRTRHALADVRERLPNSPLAPKTKPRVMLVPGGTRNVMRHDVRRRWPLAGYVQLAKAVADHGWEPVLIGDAHDRDVEQAFAGVPVTSLVGRTSLSETLAAMRDADVIVTHDTGPLHLARLVRAPIVALFGPTNPAEVVGDGADVTAVWGGATLACRPCYDGRDYARCAEHICMSGITVREVFEAVKRRMT
jgi:heptosyltransferase-2